MITRMFLFLVDLVSMIEERSHTVRLGRLADIDRNTRERGLASRFEWPRIATVGVPVFPHARHRGRC